MSDNKAKAEELLKQSKGQSRKDTEPITESDTDDVKSLEDAITDAYQAIADGDQSSNLTLRDTDLAALFHGLEDTDRLEDVGAAAADELSGNHDDAETRAGVLRLLVRIGLQEADDSTIKAAKAGRTQYLDSDTF